MSISLAEAIVSNERQRKAVETSVSLHPGRVHFTADVFGVDLKTALELGRMGYKINREKSHVENGFFTIEVGKTTVFVDIPEGD